MFKIRIEIVVEIIVEILVCIKYVNEDLLKKKPRYKRRNKTTWLALDMSSTFIRQGAAASVFKKNSRERERDRQCREAVCRQVEEEEERERRKTRTRTKSESERGGRANYEQERFLSKIERILLLPFENCRNICRNNC